MAKISRLGQKQCPKCNKWIKGTRSKTCPYCSYEFQPKTQAIKPAAVASTPAPAAIEKPATNGGTITLEQVKKVAQTIKTMGGYQRMIEVLETNKAAGGVKKFKDLAEAMTVSEADVIPF